ncbi:unnamed protein product [Caenorhabditis bovis]|uniref:Uncharacterized protein n=1 Tax=Caenorhabditis bovis TaxID=2654633 RepID=A0A8S1FE62_9PELO|nr:unnamed protein product [Caenorhabditis bovis]
MGSTSNSKFLCVADDVVDIPLPTPETDEATFSNSIEKPQERPRGRIMGIRSFPVSLPTEPPDVLEARQKARSDALRNASLNVINQLKADHVRRAGRYGFNYYEDESQQLCSCFEKLTVSKEHPVGYFAANFRQTTRFASDRNEFEPATSVLRRLERENPEFIEELKSVNKAVKEAAEKSRKKKNANPAADNIHDILRRSYNGRGSPMNSDSENDTTGSREKPDEVTFSAKYSIPLFCAHSFLSTTRITGDIKCGPHKERVAGGLLMRDDETGKIVLLAICRKCLRSENHFDKTIVFDKTLVKLMKIMYPFQVTPRDHLFRDIWTAGKNSIMGYRRLHGGERISIKWKTLKEAVKEEQINLSVEDDIEMRLVGSRSLREKFNFVGVATFIKIYYQCDPHKEQLLCGLVVGDKLTNRRLVLPFCKSCANHQDPSHRNLPSDLLTALSKFMEDNNDDHVHRFFKKWDEQDI